MHFCAFYDCDPFTSPYNFINTNPNHMSQSLSLIAKQAEIVKTGCSRGT